MSDDAPQTTTARKAASATGPVGRKIAAALSRRNASRAERARVDMSLAVAHQTVAEWLREHSERVERERVRYEMPVWLAPREGDGE